MTTFGERLPSFTGTIPTPHIHYKNNVSKTTQNTELKLIHLYNTPPDPPAKSNLTRVFSSKYWTLPWSPIRWKYSSPSPTIDWSHFSNPFFLFAHTKRIPEPHQKPHTTQTPATYEQSDGIVVSCPKKKTNSSENRFDIFENPWAWSLPSPESNKPAELYN